MSYYFTNDKNLKSNEQVKKIVIKNIPFSFYTDNGVFSKKGLDFGTRTLLENLPLLSGDILDLGCGYGPIGIYLSKNANVDMIDVNERSIALTLKNAELNNTKVNAFISNGYENISRKYDYIVTNPPIRVGKKILYDLLFNAKNYLKEDGKLYLVVNKDQGAKTLVNDLKKQYIVNIIIKNKGFYIIEAKNN